MKIAFVVGSFPELSSTFILDQVTGLLDRGHDVQVFARPPEKVEPVHAAFERYGLARRTHYWWQTPDIARLTARHTAKLLRRDARGTARVLLRSFDGLRRGSYARTGRWWAYSAAMLNAGPFDVVFAPFGTNGRIAVELRELGAFDAPIAATWLGYDLTRKVSEEGRDCYARLFARGDLMLPLSQYFRSLLLELGCPDHKIRVHHLGVNPQQFEFSPRSLSVGQAVRLITVCRLVEKKGLVFALRALRQVAAQGIEFEYHLVGDGPMRTELERLTSELGLGPRITFHGPKPRQEVANLLRQSHVFVSPSVTARDGDQEGTPVAIMEAMASGLPVVSSVHSGIPEVIEDGVSGFVVPEWDVLRLTERLAQVITQPSSWGALAQAARRTIETRYNQVLLHDELDELLRELARDYRKQR